MTDNYDERAAGFILYKNNGERKYLLLLHGNDYWNFPKGKLESGETEMETAIRELEEETGITNIKIVDGYDSAYDYTFKSRGREIKKLVKMFLAYYLEDKVIISHEHLRYEWLTFEEAMKHLKFENLTKQLGEADSFLEKNS